MRDYYDVVNSLKGGPSVKGKVSFDAEWKFAAEGGTYPIRNDKIDFGGRFVDTGARIAWSGSNAKGFSSVSEPAAKSKVVFAVLGRERNGIFWADGLP